jgi:hypothetical protein
MAIGCELGQIRKEAAAATISGVKARRTGSATSIESISEFRHGARPQTLDHKRGNKS